MQNSPLTEGQAVLMRDDNVVGEGVVTLDDLGIRPRGFRRAVAMVLWSGNLHEG